MIIKTEPSKAPHDLIFLVYTEYGKEMEKAVATDVSGDFKRALVSLIAVS